MVDPDEECGALGWPAERTSGSLRFTNSQIEEATMVKRILSATDGTARAERPLALAGTLAAEAHATPDVVHVIEYLGAGRAAGINARPDEPEIRARIEEQTAALAQRGVPCTIHLPHAIEARAAQGIPELARELDADLIVVGSRGRAAPAALAG